MKHLDLGCGMKPRNPFNAEEIFGVDVNPTVTEIGERFKCANLVLDGIPFEDSFFDSISAFDLLEHIPRQAIDFQSRITRQPFIELMDEIHRTLRPNGIFYALTPAYPAVQAFQDPTHVNFITQDTHHYFCGEFPLAKSYGFKGQFEVLEVDWMHPPYARTAQRGMKVRLKNWHKKYLKKKQVSHLVWQLKAIK